MSNRINVYIIKLGYKSSQMAEKAIKDDLDGCMHTCEEPHIMCVTMQAANLSALNVPIVYDVSTL